MSSATQAQKTKAKNYAGEGRMLKSQVLANDPEMVWGQTTFKGTRVLAATLFEYLAAGQTLDDFLEDFPMDRELCVTLLREIQELLTP